MKNILKKLVILSFLFNIAIAFGGYYNESNFGECAGANCLGSDWYIDSFPRAQSSPRPSQWPQRGFSNAWIGEEDYPDVPEQDDISGWERSVYVDHK